MIATMLGVAALPIALSSCGGGGSGNSGGGQHGSGLSITTLSPSNVMTGIFVGELTVYGNGFTNQSQILIDGEPASQTILSASGVLQAETNISLFAQPGTHQITVQQGSNVSNAETLTVYTPQPGPQVMQAMPGFLVGENETDPPYVVAADVNGDGLADVIINGDGLSNSAGIAILYGQADGTLAPATQVPVPNFPGALAVGDVDGNGTPDLVTITSIDGATTCTVSILLGDGDGNFQSPVTQQMVPGIFPGLPYLADLDGDGKPDLVFVVQDNTGVNDSIYWLKNTGGSFAPGVKLATAGRRILAIGDFNGDGKPDLIYETTTLAIHILFNNGNGTFTDQAAAGLTGLNGVVAVPNVLDFNLDGIPDLVMEVSTNTGDQLYSFKGNGDGSFTQVAVLTTTAVGQLVVGDFDHDGFPDLAGPGGNGAAGIVYFFGDGHGNFSPQLVVGPAGQFAAVGDFNGDGIPDVAIPDQFSFVSLALGRRDRNFPSALALFPATMTNVSTGDINGDGLPEIMVAGDAINNIPATVFVNLGNNSFQLAAHTNPYTGILADLTGKGVADMLGGPIDSLEIWPNNHTLDFSSTPFTIPNSSGGPYTVADMDGDGCPDIVSSVEPIFYGNCAYQFTPVNVSDLDGGSYVVGDFNGDGKLDIATGASGVFLNTGNRTFQHIANNAVPLTNGVIAVVGDFNGDGKDDIALNLPGDPSIDIYYSNGDGTFYEATDLDAGQEPAVMVAGDFNGDGRVDIAVGLLLSEQVCILFNAGGGQFTRSCFASGALAAAIAAADFNRDGKTDLVIGSFVFDFAPANVNVVFHN